MIYSALLFLCLGTGLATSTVQEIDLIEAIDQGLISVNITSRGTSSSESADVTLTNRSSRPLRVHIDPGLQLASQETFEQDLLVTRPLDILVDANKQETSPLYAFCTQSTNGTPSDGNAFRINGYSNGPLLALSDHLSENSYSPELEQEAIWNLTGDLPVAGVYTGNEDDDRRIRRFLADLKGEEIPDYVIDYGDVLNQPFEREIKRLEGEFSFFMPHAGEVNLVLKDPNGEIITRFFEDDTFRRGQYTTSFSYGSTLLAGLYTFELRIDGELYEASTIEV